MNKAEVRDAGAGVATERAGVSMGSGAGARPAGVSDEREASRQVREMFGQLAPRYDFLNHLLSLSFDLVWRRRTAEWAAPILERDGARVLDLCCGTGDLAFALERRARKLRRGAEQRGGEQRGGEQRGGAAAGRRGARVYGTDFSLPMLVRAVAKSHGAAEQGTDVPFLGSDALALPFGDGTFDLVTAAFGFRNLSNYRKGLAELARVLTSGGQLAILEFSDPQRGIAAGAFRFYFRRILPRIGGLISGNSKAYSYLPGSVAKFPAPEIFSEWIRDAGFGDVQFLLWNFGSVALHTATKK